MTSNSKAASPTWIFDTFCGRSVVKQWVRQRRYFSLAFANVLTPATSLENRQCVSFCKRRGS